MKLLFNFYGVFVQIDSESQQLLSRIENDFSYFKSTKKTPDNAYRITSNNTQMSAIKVKGKLLWQRGTTKTYEDLEQRYSIYDNRLISKYNFTTEQGQLYSKDLELLHEITYLLILSRVGKSLDLKGLHRLHAMSTYEKDSSYTCIGPSGVGKSSLCFNLLNIGHKLISDDTTLVNSKGDLEKFPIRLGLKEQQAIDKYNIKKFSTLERLKYGRKILVNSDQYTDQKAIPKHGKVCLMITSPLNKIEQSSYYDVICYMFKYLVIGVGTPVIFEYFWETGAQDFYTKTKIFFKRCLCAIRFIRRNHFTTIYSDNEISAKELLSKLPS